MSDANKNAAMQQFDTAYKQGLKHYNSCVQRGIDPHPPVLENMLGNQQIGSGYPVGTIEIPLELVVGSTTAGRRTAFTGDFLPLLSDRTEFGAKWIHLCAAHLGPSGITHPIICTEYMGKFYVTEGNKRVSVLKSYNAATISATVTRIVPPYSDDPKVQVYYEFMDFYKLSRMYDIQISRGGGYPKLQAALGFSPDHVWTEDEQLTVRHAYRKLRAVFDKLNAEDKLPLEPGDALLLWLNLYSVDDLDRGLDAEITKRMKALWPDIRLLAEGSPVTVSTEHPEGEKGGILRALGIGKPSHLNIAFVHSFDPKHSAWTAAHEAGRLHLEKAMGDRISVSSHVCTVDTADETIAQAIKDGAQVIFTTTPPLIGACRKAAAKYPHVRMLNCSLSMPYTGVRTYYSRMYEAKFIAGALAGAMATGDLIGYIANYPIAGMMATINAFALGVRMTNPRAKVSLKWSCLPGNPVDELLQEGVSIISNRGGGNYAWDWGTYYVDEHRAMIPFASPLWDWGIFYEKIVSSIFAGTWNQSGTKGEAVNYWWGLSSGVVDVHLSDKVPDGLKQLMQVLKTGMIDGITDPFRAAIRDQQGTLRCNGATELSPLDRMNMDWLCDIVIGKIPTYDEILPASRSLVRLLGLERDTLLPETEDAT